MLFNPFLLNVVAIRLSYSQIAKNSKSAELAAKSPLVEATASPRMSAQVLPSKRTPLKIDREISSQGPSSKVTTERELKPWVPDEPIQHESLSETAAALSSSSSSKNRGGKGPIFDQFAVNREKFGINPSFDESQYTTTLDRSHPDFKKREAEAERIAREIMKSPTQNIHMAEERGAVPLKDGPDGLDEEARYGAVIRGPNAYIPPSLRKNVPSNSQSSAKVAQAPKDQPVPSNEAQVETKSVPESKVLDITEAEHVKAEEQADSLPNYEEPSAPEKPLEQNAEETAPAIAEQTAEPEQIKEKVLSFNFLLKHANKILRNPGLRPSTTDGIERILSAIENKINSRLIKSAY